MIHVRGEPVTPGYLTAGGFVSAQDDQGWYDTGDLGYLTENGEIVVCGRLKDVIIMAGRNIYPTDIERAAGRIRGVRPGCAVAVRLDARHSSRSRSWWSPRPTTTRRRPPYRTRWPTRVVAEVDVRPRTVVVLAPGPSQDAVGKLRRAHALTLVGWERAGGFRTDAAIGASPVEVKGMADYDAQPGRKPRPEPRLSPEQLAADDVDLNAGLAGLAGMVAGACSVDQMLCQVA